MLFSPIADERHQDPNFPDPRKNNANIRDLHRGDGRSRGARTTCRSSNLFKPSQKFYSEAAARKESLTINGIHLTERGDKLLARAIFTAPLRRARRRRGDLEKLRAAVNDKNATGIQPLPHRGRLQRLRRPSG